MCNGLILKYLLISQLNEETVSRMIPAESVNSVALCHQSIACVSCLSRPTQHHRHNQHNFGAGLPVCWVGGSGYLYGNSPYLLFSLAVHSLNTSPLNVHFIIFVFQLLPMIHQHNLFFIYFYRYLKWAVMKPTLTNAMPQMNMEKLFALLS